MKMERLKCLHVKESLEAGVETLIGDLLPEGLELRLINGISRYIMPPGKCMEQLTGEFLGVLHPCMYNNNSSNN